MYEGDIRNLRVQGTPDVVYKRVGNFSPDIGLDKYLCFEGSFSDALSYIFRRFCASKDPSFLVVQEWLLQYL